MDKDERRKNFKLKTDHNRQEQYHGHNKRNAPQLSRNKNEKHIRNALRSGDPEAWIDHEEWLYD